MNITEAQWKKAEDHLRFYMAEYAGLEFGAGILALSLTLRPLWNRYQSGERTQELYDDMMKVE